MGDVPRAIVLVGLMGTGKSTVGRILAERLAVPLVDTDDLILERTGRTVREIFATDGEAAFRVLETAVLLDTLASEQPFVLAAAGGVVLAEANRRALQQPGIAVVWLRADPGVLVQRVVGQDHRPLLDDDPASTFARMRAEREALYAEVADVAIDVDDLTPDDVAQRTIEAIVDVVPERRSWSSVLAEQADGMPQWP